jgi:hypothetical protein
VRSSAPEHVPAVARILTWGDVGLRDPDSGLFQSAPRILTRGHYGSSAAGFVRRHAATSLRVTPCLEGGLSATGEARSRNECTWASAVFRPIFYDCSLLAAETRFPAI